jgi:aminoglycoside phosphotransferase (APT) family kinase protein
MSEQRLSGGRSVGAVRVGDSVRRPAQPWTPAVHALLRHLETVGFDGAPRVLGFDEQGREMLSYLPGETVGEEQWPQWVFTDATLIDVARWARRLHDATADFVPPQDAAWFAGQPWQPELIIGHHDAAPWNAVWRNGSLAGFVDWDTAGPSAREFELAYLALTWVPLFAPEFVAPLGFTASHDRSRRFHLLLDAYGYDGPRDGFRDLIARRARINADVVHRLAAHGEPAYVAMLGWAQDLERAAVEVESLPAQFWTRSP